MKGRGLKSARFIVGEGHLGLWEGAGEIFPEAGEQICSNHKILNGVDAVSKKDQAKAKGYLKAMMYAD